MSRLVFFLNFQRNNLSTWSVAGYLVVRKQLNTVDWLAVIELSICHTDATDACFRFARAIRALQRAALAREQLTREEVESAIPCEGIGLDLSKVPIIQVPTLAILTRYFAVRKTIYSGNVRIN